MNHPGRRLRALLVGLAIILVSGLVAATIWVERKLRPEEVRGRVAEILRETLGPAGLDASIGDVRLELGEALRITDLEITSGRGPVLRVRSLSLALTTGDLLSGELGDAPVSAEGFELTLRRAAGESWEIERILDALPAAGKGPAGAQGPVPPLTLLEGRIRILDESASEPVSIVIENVAGEWMPLAPASSGTARAYFDLRGGGGPLRSLALSGTWNGPHERVRVSHLEARLDLSRRGDWSLPALDTFLDCHEARGRIDLFGQLELAPEGELVESSIVASLSGGRARTGEQGLVLQSLSGSASLHGRHLVLERLEGNCTAGSFGLRGAAEIAGAGLDSLAPASLRMRLELPEARIDEAFIGALPPALATPLARNVIHGLATIQATLDCASWPPVSSDWSLRVAANGISVTPEFFAIPIETLRGELDYSDGRLQISPALEGDAITGTVSARGSLSFVTDGTEASRAPVSGSVTVSWRGVSCCRAVRDLLKERSREVWDSFSPVGKTDGEAILSWGDPGVTPGIDGAPTGIKVVVRPVDAGFQFRGFPLPVSALRGELVFDLVERTLEVRSLSGRYRDREIRGDGLVRFPRDRPETVDLRIHAASADVNRELVQCLPPDIAAAVQRHRVAGEAGIDVHLTSDASGALRFALKLALHEDAPLVVHPPALPTPLVLTSGTISIREDRVVLQEVGGRGPAEFEIDGEIARQGEWTRATIRGQVRDLELDGRFKTFLSEKNREAFERIQLRGVHDFHFESEFVITAPAGSPKEYRYHLTGLHTRGGGLGVAVHLAELEATGELRGRGIAGQTHTGSGELLVRSARFNRLHMENARVYFVYGEDHPALAAGEHGEALDGYDYVVPPEFRKRLKPGTLGDTLQILLGPAELYRGELAGFGYADLGALQDLRGHFVVKGMDIGRAARDIFYRNDLEARGAGGGEVRFSGLTSDSASLQGQGSIEVHDGDIAQIPVLSSILGQLGLGKAVDLDGMRAKFSIFDEKFNVRKGDLVVTGPALNVRGGGTMDFDGVLDLTMTPEFISGKLPVFDQIKENLAHVRVHGGLSNPKAELVFARFLPLPLGDR